MKFPESLQCLSLGDKFDQQIDEVQWPNTLKSLSFGDKFNGDVCGVQLPNTLESLSIGDTFQQPVDYLTLPSTLQELRFGSSFNWPLDHLHLHHLRSLTLGKDFKQSLAALPSTLQTLILESTMIPTDLPILPRTLEVFKCNNLMVKAGP